MDLYSHVSIHIFQHPLTGLPAQAALGDQVRPFLLGGKYAPGRSIVLYWSEDINILVRALEICKYIYTC